MSVLYSMGAAGILLIQKIPASAIALTISAALISCTASVFTIAPFSITFIFFMALGSICVSSFIVKPSDAGQDVHRLGKSLSYMSTSSISVRNFLSSSALDEQRGGKDMTDRYPGPGDKRFALISSDLPSSPWKLVRKILKKTRKYIRPVKKNISTFFVTSVDNSSTSAKSFISISPNNNDAQVRLNMLESSKARNWNFSYKPFDQWLCADDSHVYMLPIKLFPLNAENLSVRYSMDLEEIFDRNSLASNVTSMVRYHYTCPPTSLEALRQRYGTSRSLWGEWSNKETRHFYKTQLPLALQIDGSLGLSLQERAELASACRHALRIYSRERCHLPGRILARLYDGLRHIHDFGYWSENGMTWAEVKQKYKKEVLRTMKVELAAGSHISDEELENRVYKIILDRACSTNAFFDKIAEVSPNPAPASSSFASTVPGGGDVRSKQTSKRRKLREVYRTLLRDLASSVPALVGGKHSQWLVESIDTGNVLHRVTATGGEGGVPEKSNGSVLDDRNGLHKEDICCDLTSFDIAQESNQHQTRKQQQQQQEFLSVLFPPVLLTLSFRSITDGPAPFVTAVAFQEKQMNTFSLSTKQELLERMPPWSQWITDFISVQLALASDAVPFDKLERLCSSATDLLGLVSGVGVGFLTDL
eukprot:gene33509-43302_t